MNRRAHTAILLLMAACSGEDTGEVAPAENTGPTLDHDTPAPGAVDGDPLVIEVTATDPSGVASVVLFWRDEGDAFWESLALDKGDSNLWSGEVGPLSSPGVEYYFEAVDASGSAAFSRLPVEGEYGPLRYGVLEGALNLPWFEDFERPDGPVSLYRMDWWTPSSGLDVYTWTQTSSESYSGESAAFHTRVPEGDRDGLIDWLVSPPLNLTSMEQPTVRWQEYGSSGANIAGHYLGISVGSPDPADEEYEQVAALAAPLDEAWARSPIYDLSPWADAEVAYLAWVYVGGGNDWYIDDVEVVPLEADPTASVTWDPDPLRPGDDAQVTVLFTNNTAAEATGLEATLSFPEGGATVETNPMTVGDLEGDGSAAVAFSVTLDEDVCDTCYLPVRIQLENDDLSWEFDSSILVGVLSVATVDLALASDAPVNVKVGVGDPDDPTLELPVYSGVLAGGAHSLEVDITDHSDLLPAAAGDLRWYATVSTAETGVVSAFRVASSEGTQSATVLPPLSENTLVWLPEPPDPAVTTVAPSATAPGAVDVPLTINLTNTGAATVGPVTGDLVSVSPNVSVSNASELVITDGVWSSAATASTSGPLLTVGADHNQSQPALLDFTLTDGADTWVERVAVPVPWPYLVAAGTEIDDSGGDGVLDNGETATLRFDIANTGDLDTFDRLTATLRLASTSTATATLPTEPGSLFAISSGGTRSEDFDVEVTSGATGDTLDLEVVLEDGTATYVVPVQIELGVPPWQALTPFDDDIGDALDAYAFDLQRAEYRVTGTEVELRLTSATPYDPSTVFLEAWGSSSGAPWDYYRWVVQPGAAGLYGLDNSGTFTELSTLGVDTSSSTQIVLSFDTTDMNLIIDRFRLGLAAGWCGPDTYFCDHYPNGWGWPYVSFDPGSWYELSW